MRAEQLEREITELCAHINAATYRLLVLILELDREAPWGAWGLNSCAHWLNWKCGIGLVAAREKVRAERTAGDVAVPRPHRNRSTPVRFVVLAGYLDGGVEGLRGGRGTATSPVGGRR